VALSCWQPPPEGVTPREAAAGRYQRDGYMIEPAADFNHRAGYLSVSKTHRDSRFRGSYAFKEVPRAPAPQPCPGGRVWRGVGGRSCGSNAGLSADTTHLFYQLWTACPALPQRAPCRVDSSGTLTCLWMMMSHSRPPLQAS